MDASQNPRRLTEGANSAWTALSCSGVMGFMVAQCGGSTVEAAAAASLFVVQPLRKLLDAHRERNGDKSPLPVSFKRDGDRRAFADAAAYRWLADLKSNLSFEDFVTELAECSNHYGRRFSVTCVKIAGLSKNKTELVACLMRSRLRATDVVRSVSDSEFLVCTPLLKDALSADVIAKRLGHALVHSNLLDAKSTLSLGKAISPRDGYSGPDLIKSARDALRPVASPETRRATDEAKPV